MKLSQLKQIIKEEVKNVLKENMLQAKWKTMSFDDKEKLISMYVEDPDDVENYVTMDWNQLPDVVTSNLSRMSQTDINKELHENVKMLKETIMNPKAFCKLFIQNIKNGLVNKPATYKDLKDSLDYVSSISGIVDLKKTYKKEYDEILGHLASHYDLKK